MNLSFLYIFQTMERAINKRIESEATAKASTTEVKALNILNSQTKKDKKKIKKWH